ncbi:hypothetical protein CRE_14543 [Caenorhabditis remanei]|uniref:BHLH domain-containing protein n=1 Tax=Caenorhabditis remanei TaxID=31234 RepID=E3M9G5_CAERE|nr:hypothetical protein CRE_14543 [Caenorhabditis remanei]
MCSSSKTTVTRAAHRAKRTEQERNRVHGLNDALDTLKKHIPVLEHHKKLCKVDTLRLAINYIHTLQQMLESDKESTLQEHARTLQEGLSYQAILMLEKSLNLPVEVDPVVTSHTSSSSSSTPSSSTSPQYSLDKWVYMDNGVWVQSGVPVPQDLQTRKADWKPVHSFSISHLLREKMMN